MGTHRVAHGHNHIATKKKIEHENHVSEHEIIFILLIFHLNRHIILYVSEHSSLVEKFRILCTDMIASL